MKRKTMLLARIVIIILWCVGCASALKCYTCHSDVMPNCADTFMADGVERPTCPNAMDHGVCTKTKQDGVVTRGCGQKEFCHGDVTGGEDSCRTTSGKTSCCCKADGCNSALKRRGDPTLLLLATVLVLLLNNMLHWGSAVL